MSQEQINRIISHNDKEIKGFFNEYRWLSNFHKCQVEYDGVVYPSSENAYQAAKTLNVEERKMFLTCEPSEAKKLGQTITLRKDWEDIKDFIMMSIQISKYAINDDLGVMLEETQGKYLEETNWWGDTYWGMCLGVGKNKLGKCLMIFRDMILTSTLI